MAYTDFVDRAALLRLAIVATVVLCPMSSSNSGGLPRNPQRPMNATTCEEAKLRLEEAKLGSALISDEENARVLELAIQQYKRLCGEEP